MRVLLTGASSSNTGAIAFTPKPCACASSARRSALPSRLRPKDQPSPIATCLRSGKTAGDFADERGGRHVAQRFVELHGDDGDRALRAHVGDFLFERGQARRHAVGRDDGERMRLEGERVDAAVQAFHHGLVPEMDAVEDANGQPGDVPVRAQFGDGNGADEHNFYLATKNTKITKRGGPGTGRK